MFKNYGSNREITELSSFSLILFFIYTQKLKNCIVYLDMSSTKYGDVSRSKILPMTHFNYLLEMSSHQAYIIQTILFMLNLGEP